MNLPPLLNTPLAATAGVLLGMTLLAMPLQQLTSQEATPRAPATADKIADSVESWVVLKLLAPAKSAALQQADGTLLWSAQSLPPGEHESRLPIPGDAGLVLTVDFEDPAKETAAFLTIAPDGFEEVTRYAIGSGRIRELLDFHWTGE